MRRGLLAGVALGATNAAAVLVLAWLFRGPSEFGWYAYSPMPRRYSDYLPADHAVSSWATVLTVVAVLVAVNVAAAVGYTLLRGRKSR
jgi:heme/copper-type cytochrome/quinol oxidase subunit 1